MSRGQNKQYKWFLALLIFFIAFFLVAFGREYVGNMQVRHYIEDLQDQREFQEQEQLETMALIQGLSSEYFLESEGRVKQGLGRTDETVVIIQDDEFGSDLNMVDVDDGMTNVSRWFYYFFSPHTFRDLGSYESI